MQGRATGRRPIVPLLAGVCVVLVFVAVAATLAVLNMRDSTLRTAENSLKSLSVALAEQANRTFHGVDLVLNDITDFINAAEIDNPGLLARHLAGRDVHFRLEERLTGLPFLVRLTIADAEGRVVNASDVWPSALRPSSLRPSSLWPSHWVDLSGEEHFQAVRQDPAVNRFVSRPEQDKVKGHWILHVVRPLATRDGAFAGVVVGTVSLGYFHEVYAAVSRGIEQTISLLRQDDVLMARFPATNRAGLPVPMGDRRDAGFPATGPVRGQGDGLLRIRASADLADFPMTVHVTQPRSVALRDWTGLAWMIGLVSLGCLLWIGIAALALARWWRQLQALGLERAERAEAERARAVAEADLARERERHAEEASKAKSGFLAMMSHEIRTPMNGVLGLTGTLLDGELTAQQRRVVEAIRDSGDSLLRILNDILDLSKLDAGRMTFEDMAFSPVTLTHGIVSILGPRARAKGLIITVSCDHALPEALLGDAGRIRQVLLNLVSNAIKFTEAGSVTIECRQTGVTDGRAGVQWVVRDTGIGIAPDRIGRLFGDFVQADTSISRRFGGTGMGLAISRRLVEQMGGGISVESEPGQGTTFRVDLTLPVTAPLTGQERRVADVIGAFDAYLRTLGRPLRLLFAEDNPTNQFVALQMLRAFNVQVDVAGDGLEAVDAATTFLYDVICMDMQMPEMDGLEATRLIRRQGGRLGDLPIIALTANAFPEDVKACLDAGMNLFVAKPVHKETLLHAILTALGALTRFTELEPSRPEAAAEPPPPDNSVPAAADPASAVDAAVLAEMEDAIGQDGVAEMVRLFLSETRIRLDRLAQAGRDPSIDLREIHTLKGAAATVGAPVLTAFALETEERLREGGSLSAADVERLRRHFDAWHAAIVPRIPLDQPQESV